VKVDSAAVIYASVAIQILMMFLPVAQSGHPGFIFFGLVGLLAIPIAVIVGAGRPWVPFATAVLSGCSILAFFFAPGLTAYLPYEDHFGTVEGVPPGPGLLALTVSELGLIIGSVGLIRSARKGNRPRPRRALAPER
jgi:hypothetical protein